MEKWIIKVLCKVIILYGYIALVYTACDNGWFGSSCQYKCHCDNNNCNDQGLCLTGSSCERGWFGPLCQYQDLSTSNAVITPANSSIADGDDSTCTYQQNVTISWTISYLIDWMRVVFQDSGTHLDILIELVSETNTSFPCSIISNHINATTVDIVCNETSTVRKIFFGFHTPRSICSIYISGGRNVALKMATWQSSNFNDSIHGPIFVSSKAVDGNSSGDFYKTFTCTHTDKTPTPSIWGIKFPQPMIVTRYVLYNRADGNQQRLKGFNLVSYNVNNVVLLNYTGAQQGDFGLDYDITTTGNVGVSYVNITAKQHENILTLCEVEVYGDQVCQPNTYGLECNNTCSCGHWKEKSCFVATGQCFGGCDAGYFGKDCSNECLAGFYGENCSMNCSRSCWNQMCDRFNGTCTSCIDGKVGPLCETDCNDTFYGENCQHPCSINCKDQLCDKENGTCFSCLSGQMGQKCENSCDDHHYGPNCIYNCSINCEKLQCNETNGYCYNCIAGYKGDFCNITCDNDRYGVNCKENCSHWCKQNATETWCNKTDGQCLIGCNKGFTKENTECSSWSLESKEDDTATTLVPIVVPIVIVLMTAMLAVASVVFWRRRKQNKSKSTRDNSRQGSNNVLTTTFGADEGTNHTHEKGDSSKATRKVAIVNAYCNVTDNTFIQVSQLNEFMRSKNSKYFATQFKSIPAPQNVSMSAGLSEENRNKNRYKNICAYDHSRVHLEINTSKNEGDYINASYIEGYNNEEKFIASQGPTDVNINDFVRMLWEQRVDKVVMLTKLIEEGKVKCVSYWPEEGTTTFGDIKVNLAATHVFADYTIRKLELIKKGQTTHQFTQFHFTSWPDQGAPITPWGLVDFEQRVALDNTPKPILVHCSAGVGRTGTFIALRNVMREAEDTGLINCFQTVAKLRQDRILMVQTAEQYEFLHKAAQVAIVCMGTTVTCSDITSRISHLEEQLVTGSCKLEKEFKAVSEVCLDLVQKKDDDTQGIDSNIYQNNTSSNSTKDRFSSIIPSKFYQTVLSKESNNLGDYINAVLVTGFTKGENQILTHLPMPNTVTDFWRLVAQYNVKLVVAFQMEESAQKESFGQYLPASMTTPLDCGPYEIHTGPVKSESLWEEQQITVKVVKKSIVSVSNEIHVTHISSKSTDLNPKNLLKLLKHTRSNNVQAQGRVLYMCRNGAEYSGLACVLSLLLDRMDHDQSLTVPLVVGAIKCIRPQVIPSLDQYRCVYQVLKRYNEATQTYNNYDQLSIPLQTGYVDMEIAQQKEENVYANS